MHYAEQVWANKAKEEGILIGEGVEIQKNARRTLELPYS